MNFFSYIRCKNFALRNFINYFGKIYLNRSKPRFWLNFIDIKKHILKNMFYPNALFSVLRFLIRKLILYLKKKKVLLINNEKFNSCNFMEAKGLGLIYWKKNKTLVKIQGKPIIWYIVKFLKKNSFNHFILPVGYKGMQINISKERDFNNMNIEIVTLEKIAPISKRIDKIKKNIKSDNFFTLMEMQFLILI